jgi:hypothetical protein
VPKIPNLGQVRECTPILYRGGIASNTV